MMCDGNLYPAYEKKHTSKYIEWGYKGCLISIIKHQTNNKMATIVNNTPAMSEFAQDAIKAARSATRAPRTSAKVKIVPTPDSSVALPIPIETSSDNTNNEIVSDVIGSDTVGTNNSIDTTSHADTIDDPIQTELNQLANQVAGIMSTMKDVSASIKVLQRTYQRTCKAHAAALHNATGKKKRVARTGEPRQQALGSASPAMTLFLGLTPGEFISRKKVSEGLNQYIKAESLQLPTDGRVIVPNDALRTLLNVEPSTKLTYFNMQKLINPHFKVAKKNPDDGSLESHVWE
jgi:hypothetical protein